MQVIAALLIPLTWKLGGPIWGHVLASLCVYGGMIAHLLYAEIGRQKRIKGHLLVVSQFELATHAKGSKARIPVEADHRQMDSVCYYDGRCS